MCHFCASAIVKYFQFCVFCFFNNTPYSTPSRSVFFSFLFPLYLILPLLSGCYCLDYLPLKNCKLSDPPSLPRPPAVTLFDTCWSISHTKLLKGWALCSLLLSWHFTRWMACKSSIKIQEINDWKKVNYLKQLHHSFCKSNHIHSNCDSIGKSEDQANCTAKFWP